MTAFRLLLIVMFVVVAGYTVLIVPNHGFAVVPTAIAGIQAMDWQGQFNLDFITFVVLAGLWIAWWHEFSLVGLVLALGITGGMIYLALYLLILSFMTNGDVVEMLIGSKRARG